MSNKGKGIPRGRFSKSFLVINLILVLLVMAVFFGFIYSYSNLKNSIAEERADSVRQMASLISDRVYQLKQSYAREVTQTAWILQNIPEDSESELTLLLAENSKLILLDERGNYYAGNGATPLITDPELLTGLAESDEVTTSFATIQTKGDYWLFARPLQGVEIGGVRYIGAILAVSAQEYADVATITLYDHLGESLVVSKEGTIKMRSSDTEASSSFSGYNLLKILEKTSMSASDLGGFTQALKDCTDYAASFTLNGVTWLLQSTQSDSGRNLVVLVPVSLTAQSTYREMTNTLVYTALCVVLLAMLFLYNFVVILKRNQQIEVEHARSKSKSDFLDKMSHDIRTPLNAIVGMHELALESIDDQALVYDCLIKARKSCDYLVGIINDVLDMSRIESGKMTISRKPFDLKELIGSVIEIESAAAAEKNISLTARLETPIVSGFQGDGQRLRQCLMNLVNNAVKFTPRDGHIVVSYSSVPQGDTYILATFEVSDDGIGMSEEFQQHIFKPFEQEQNSLYNSYAGSGLGLSIVHDFIMLMGGNIFVKSKKNEGSTFTIRLPLEILDGDLPEEQAPDDSELERQLQGRHVLLVEDNAINRQILSMLLSRMGLAVEEAENGQEAVSVFGKSPENWYSLILMDIMMPVMGGLEAASLIRRLPRQDAGTVPIVALSANAFEEDAKKSLAAGMQMHLAKPVNVGELKRVLKKYIS